MIVNKRLDKAWRSIAQYSFNWKTRISNDDIIKGDSKLSALVGGIDAILYCLFLYARITNVYEDTKTWEEWKTLYEYDTYKKLFAQYGIDLDEVALTYFELETLAGNGGVDSNGLVNAVIVIRNFVCGCVDPVQDEPSMTEPRLIEVEA